MKNDKKLKKLPFTVWLFGSLAAYSILSISLWIITLFWSVLSSFVGLVGISILLNSYNISIGNYLVFIGMSIFLLFFPVTLIVDIITYAIKHKIHSSTKRTSHNEWKN